MPGDALAAAMGRVELFKLILDHSTHTAWEYGQPGVVRAGGVCPGAPFFAIPSLAKPLGCGHLSVIGYLRTIGVKKGPILFISSTFFFWGGFDFVTISHKSVSREYFRLVSSA